MTTVACPRCFCDLPAGKAVRFCARCGLPDVVQAATDIKPILLQANGRSYRVMERLWMGSFASLYRCDIGDGPSRRVGLLKIVRDSRANFALENEANVLRRLACTKATRFQAFIPLVVDSFRHADPGSEPARQANILAYDPEIASPNELYTLEEVLAAYPSGMDAKDVAWMWRRLLCIIGFCHVNRVVHSAVLPGHVLIEPTGHKLVLIDWCFASIEGRDGSIIPSASSGVLSGWFERESIARPISHALDISLAARCMAALLVGDSFRREYPTGVDAAIRRHFDRCIDLPEQSHPTAQQLLKEFDELIDALWGRRKFRVLTMPPRR